MKKIFLLAAAILFLGAGCSSQLTSNNVPATQTNPVVDSSVSQVRDLQDQLSKTKDALLEKQVQYQVLAMFNSKNLFRHPLDKNKFIFVTKNIGRGVNEQEIIVYNFAKDLNYQKIGDVTLEASTFSPTTLSYLYQEKISANNEFRLVDMDGSKLVIWETDIDNSPGPCDSVWLASNLTFVDVDAVKPKREAYVVSKTRRDEATREVANCEKAL